MAFTIGYEKKLAGRSISHCGISTIMLKGYLFWPVQLRCFQTRLWISFAKGFCTLRWMISKRGWVCLLRVLSRFGKAGNQIFVSVDHNTEDFKMARSSAISLLLHQLYRNMCLVRAKLNASPAHFGDSKYNVIGSHCYMLAAHLAIKSINSSIWLFLKVLLPVRWWGIWSCHCHWS